MTKKKTRAQATMREQIRATREKLGVSQESLARMIGCSYMSVHRWENGQGEPGTLHMVVLDALRNIADDAPEAGRRLEKTVGTHGLGYTVYTLLDMVHGSKKHG
jgi:ribosome-binding protein aMBF1 (putative translation factor)